MAAEKPAAALRRLPARLPRGTEFWLRPRRSRPSARRGGRGRGRGGGAGAPAGSGGARGVSGVAPPRLPAHRRADHALLLLAHGRGGHRQGRAGAHGGGARGHRVGRDRLQGGAELLLHQPGRGHRRHRALHHPHRGHHHRCPAPGQRLGPLRPLPKKSHLEKDPGKKKKTNKKNPHKNGENRIKNGENRRKINKIRGK